MTGRALATALRSRRFARGVALFWLGQSSWVFVLDTGQVVYVDPYLSAPWPAPTVGSGCYRCPSSPRRETATWC